MIFGRYLKFRIKFENVSNYTKFGYYSWKNLAGDLCQSTSQPISGGWVIHFSSAKYPAGRIIDFASCCIPSSELTDLVITRCLCFFSRIFLKRKDPTFRNQLTNCFHMETPFFSCPCRFKPCKGILKSFWNLHMRIETDVMEERTVV